MPTNSDIATALASIRLRLPRDGMFSAREVVHELGAADDETASAMARQLATFSHIEAKTIGAAIYPDGLWGFV
jgi:hypothetical protein